MKRYNPKEIEKTWQKYWEDNKTYVPDLNDQTSQKYFGMDMFNYPSALGLHIGHAFSFTVSDVISRFHRQMGFNTFLPVGWDSFGLPAENYAVKVGRKPQDTTAEAIENYRANYIAMGFSRDWSREINTCQPEYYKWNQWLFLKLYEHGLVYQASAMQWWCDNCQTVLANEQVTADGKCWRHDTAEFPEISKKEIKQWFFKVTEYADELLDAIDDLDWTNSVKLAQKNWIGKSKGAEVDFELASQQVGELASKDKITVFTTRPDTLFGATFLVLAPEHELASKLTVGSEKSKVESYIKEAGKKTEVERQASKEKTGVFTGSYAINPINNQKIPVWIADYVLVGYGTGAIMAVPAHDERDYDFAKKFGLNIIEVVEKPEGFEGCFDGEGLMINSGDYDVMLSSDAREKIVADLTKRSQATDKTIYKMRDWSISRQRYWGTPIPIVNCQTCGPVVVPEKDLPVVLPELDDFQPSGDGRSALARAIGWKETTCPNCGKYAERETETMDTFVDSSWYMFRFLSPKDSIQAFDPDLAKKWFPVDFYDGADHATMHLLYARFITRFFHKLGLSPTPEPFKKFLFHGKVTAADGTMFSKSKGNGVDPLEIIAQGYGADALRTYLMFAAPLDLWIRWDPQGVPGTYRFINRVWNLVQEYLESRQSPVDGQQGDDKVMRIVHPAIKKVTGDIEELKYNTAIATLMKCCNDLYELKAKDKFVSSDWKFGLEALVMMIGPFAPHAAEELWHDLGNTDSVHRGHWPLWDDKYLVEDTMTIAVQVNGKLRGTISVASDTTKEDIIIAAGAIEKVKAHLGGEPKKTIYVPNKLVNFVV